MFVPTSHRRKTTAEPAGAAAARVLAPHLAARGFPAASILQDWAHIVGRDLAAFVAPERLVWPRAGDGRERPDPRRRRLEGATLTVRVSGPRAIEVQHEADRILERLNAHFGWRAITGLRIVQGPARPRRERSDRRHEPRHTAVDEGASDRSLGAALARLRAAVKSS
jgi:hypothetical protein